MSGSSVLASAQPFGFGPAAKLVAVVEHLGAVRASFYGNGIALRYAQVNGDHFDAVEEFDFSDLAAALRLVGSFDCALSVMEPQLVLACVRRGVPVMFFDSLFGFWRLDHNLADLADVARTVRGGDDAQALAAFAGLSVHESMVVSHMIATRSYAQMFPGVARRRDQLAELGFDTVTATGSMANLAEIEHLRGLEPRLSRTLVLNLGGFTNAFLDYDRRGGYVDILMAWTEHVARTRDDFDEIVICTGAFGDSVERRIGNVALRCGLVPHAEFLRLVARRPVYLTPPGLTSLHEAVVLGTPAMLLPSQHHGHEFNRRSLDGTSAARWSASFDGLGIPVDLPDDDFRGTVALAELADRIRADEGLLAAFVANMDRELDAFVSRTDRDSDQWITDLAAVFAGEPIARVMATIEEEADGCSSRPVRTRVGDCVPAQGWGRRATASTTPADPAPPRPGSPAARPTTRRTVWPARPAVRRRRGHGSRTARTDPAAAGRPTGRRPPGGRRRGRTRGRRGRVGSGPHGPWAPPPGEWPRQRPRVGGPLPRPGPGRLR